MIKRVNKQIPIIHTPPIKNDPTFVRSRGREYILKSGGVTLFNILDEDHLRIRVQSDPQAYAPPRNNKSGIRMFLLTPHFLCANIAHQSPLPFYAFATLLQKMGIGANMCMWYSESCCVGC